MSSRLAIAPSALADLNGTGNYVHWGFLQISWANAIVILAMIAVFIIAVVLPFPGSKR